MNVKDLIKVLRKEKRGADARIVVNEILDEAEKKEKKEAEEKLPVILWEVILVAEENVVERRTYRVMAKTMDDAVEGCNEIDPISVEEVDREEVGVSVVSAEPTHKIWVEKPKPTRAKRKANQKSD